MADEIRLQEDYVLARCCSPSRDDQIVGYYSRNKQLRVHRVGCPSLRKVSPARLLQLEWDSIVQKRGLSPGDDYGELDKVDFAILAHHQKYGIDYSLVVAKAVSIDSQMAFQRHRKLRTLGLLKRVDAVMVQYRKGVTDHKWIKHRNHTYYDLTPKGSQYLNHHLSGGLPGPITSRP